MSASEKSTEFVLPSRDEEGPAIATLSIGAGRVTWNYPGAGIFGPLRYEWPVEQIEAVRTVKVGARTHGQVGVLFAFVAGQQFRLYEGRNTAEMYWLATALRSTLGVPGIPRPECQAPLAQTVRD